MTTIREVRAALRPLHAADIEMYRSPKGYYYFTGAHRYAGQIPSLYTFNLTGWSTAEILRHIENHIRKEG